MSFNSILIPVDLSLDTGIPINKVIELIEYKDSTVYLLCIIKVNKFQRKIEKSLPTNNNSTEMIRKMTLSKLLNLELEISDKLPHVKIKSQVEIGKFEQSLILAIKNLQPNLVILDPNINHSIFSLNRHVLSDTIVKTCNCAVLIAKKRNSIETNCSIVVPIENYVPLKKIELLSTLSKKYRLSIYLVTLLAHAKEKGFSSSNAVLQTYKILTGHGMPLIVEHAVLKGNSLSKAALKYAQYLNADMLLVHPYSETIFNSFLNIHISSKLLPNSKLQVLEIGSTTHC